MVMHRALFTWFILLIFFIFLCLRLESRITWNWFLIFLPMWVYDVILFMDGLVHIFVRCTHDETLRTVIGKKDNYIVFVVILKIATQILLCLKLEYASLGLSVWHVMVPFWILVPLLIVDVSIKLFKSSY